MLVLLNLLANLSEIVIGLTNQLEEPETVVRTANYWETVAPCLFERHQDQSEPPTKLSQLQDVHGVNLE